ncbi:hypothetical protein EYF80_030116 [Liparis tanakae]|uniref:Uncharacterized protein n=1 Tax=Liparis tanakae TaxID=230148 RepID=A0A4Z2H2E9_9TELE|nr:hypothetical protein EYF80_030116 [Liparis tanakae]
MTCIKRRTSVVLRGGGGGGGLQVSPLVLSSQLGPQSPGQRQQAGPSAERQAGVGQPRWVWAHWQTMGVLGEVLGLKLLLQRGRTEGATRRERERVETEEREILGHLQADGRRGSTGSDEEDEEKRELSAAMCTRGQTLSDLLMPD